MKSNKKNAAWAAVLASILTVSSISAVAMAAIDDSDGKLTADKSAVETALKALTVNANTTKDELQAEIDKLDTLNYEATVNSVTVAKNATETEDGSLTVSVTYTDEESSETEDDEITLTIEKTGTTSEPTTSEPTTSEPTTSEPTTSEPTTSEPTTSEPTTSEPTTSEPTTSEPTTSEPTTSEPTTSEPTTSEPTTSEPTTSEPTTSEGGEGGDGEIGVDGDLTGDLDVKDAPIYASDNAINEKVTITVSAGVVSKDSTTGISIVVDEEDSTVAKFVANPPAKTTDVLNWINDTVTTEEAGKIKELQAALNAVADGKAFVLNFDVLDGEDNSVTLTKPVKVTVPVAENLLPNINDIKVYHVTADGLVLIESTVDEDNNIVFETTGFSPFIFSVEDLLTTAPAGDDDGEGDKEPINTGIALATIPVVIAGAAVVVAARKKKNG